MKFKKFIIRLIVLGIIVFGFYLYKLHRLALDGNKIFEYRCTNVNPPLISYKNSFLGFADYLRNPEKYTIEEVEGFFDGYIFGMREYVEEENRWLEMQGELINRWDYRLIEPWYIKQAGEYQLKMYEGYRDDAKYMLEMIDNGGLTEELNIKQTEAKEKRNKYEKLYFDFFDEAMLVNDWRKIFGSVPVSEKCNDENLIIPDTGGSIDWEESPLVTPDSELVDPETVS